MNRWDAFFYKIATAVAEQSLCLNWQVGAVLVRNKRIIATGYNGPPDGVPPCRNRIDTDPAYRKLWEAIDVPWSGTMCPRRVLKLGHGEGRELCPAAHAETNVILNAARMGVCVEGSSMYLSCYIPCKSCLSNIINAGISEIVCTSLGTHDDLTQWILTFSRLRIRTYE